jgi:hypothetical protein
MWEPRRLTTLWASTACYRDSFTFLPYFENVGAPSLSDVGRYVVVRMFSVYFRYSYAGRKFRHTFWGLLFRNVAYTKYEVHVIVKEIYFNYY